MRMYHRGISRSAAGFCTGLLLGLGMNELRTELVLRWGLGLEWQLVLVDLRLGNNRLFRRGDR